MHLIEFETKGWNGSVCVSAGSFVRVLMLCNYQMTNKFAGCPILRTQKVGWFNMHTTTNSSKSASSHIIRDLQL